MGSPFDSVRANLVGLTFGRLTVLERRRIAASPKHAICYLCNCVCGTQLVVSHTNLRSGSTKSCGCLRTALLKQRAKSSEAVISRAVYNYYKRNASNRNLYWYLSFDEVKHLILQPCFYCGIEEFTVTKSRGHTLKHNGIDRMDNLHGYTPENCVPCCRTCNFAKNNLALDEFMAWIQRIKNAN